MALKQRLTPIALGDLDNALEFIAADKPQAAVSVAKKIMDGVEQLKKFPESGREGRVPETRELFISTTPFFIVYRVHKDHLDILNILHSSKKWP